MARERARGSTELLLSLYNSFLCFDLKELFLDDVGFFPSTENLHQGGILFKIQGRFIKSDDVISRAL